MSNKTEQGWFLALGTFIWLWESTIIYQILQKDLQKMVNKLFNHGGGRTPLKMGANLRQSCLKMQGWDITVHTWIMSPEFIKWPLSVFNYRTAEGSCSCPWCWRILHKARAFSQSLVWEYFILNILCVKKKQNKRKSPQCGQEEPMYSWINSKTNI